MSSLGANRPPGPSLAGILNITEDSFSDGGRFIEPARAVDHAHALHRAGATLVDLGPASSHPDSADVGNEREIARLEPLVAALAGAHIDFGVDSYETATQRFALAHGARWLNDIEGFADESFWGELAEAKCDLVVMHSIQGRGRATREVGDANQIVDRVLAFFEARIRGLTDAGVSRGRIIVDPGMGFFLGATAEPSLEVLRALPRLRTAFDCRVLVSVSRKSFVGAICADPETNEPRPVAERLPGTLAAELYAARMGVDWIRTHDVRSLADALRTTARLEGVR
ncbi:MAG: dihydropteroate synthase [Myxococcota bacterium]|nr:dihydropteroate synthase [Myxococcota bacterium]